MARSGWSVAGKRRSGPLETTGLEREHARRRRQPGRWAKHPVRSRGGVGGRRIRRSSASATSARRSVPGAELDRRSSPVVIISVAGPVGSSMWCWAPMVCSRRPHPPELFVWAPRERPCCWCGHDMASAALTRRRATHVRVGALASGSPTASSARSRSSASPTARTVAASSRSSPRSPTT